MKESVRIIRPLLVAALGCFWTVAAMGQVAAGKAALVERGKVLMEGVVACGNCHVARDATGKPLFDKGLSGGMVFDLPPFRAVAPNITPDPTSGIGKWSDAQLVRAIREGVRPDGSLIGPPMPFEYYRHISDQDAAAIVAYLRAQPAVANSVEKSVYRMPLPKSYGPPLERVVAPLRGKTVAYGEYLARIGHCMECHTPMDDKGHAILAKFGAGGMLFPGPWGQSVSRNLTPHATGLKGWSDAEIARAIREGISRDGTPLKPPMAFGWYKNIDDADMAALIKYLRSLKSQPFAGKG